MRNQALKGLQVKPKSPLPGLFGKGSKNDIGGNMEMMSDDDLAKSEANRQEHRKNTKMNAATCPGVQ